MQYRFRNSLIGDSKGGMALLWSVFLVFVVSAAAFTTGAMSSIADDQAQLAYSRSLVKSKSFAATEYALEELVQAVRIGADPELQGTVDLDGQQANYTVEQAGMEFSETTSDGLYRVVSIFRIEGSCNQRGVNSVTRRVVRTSVTPLFQFAMFFQNDMEFFNPEAMTIKGRVHCNSDIYMLASSPLVFDTNYLHAAGGVYGRQPAGFTWPDPYLGFTPNAPELRRWVADPFDPTEVVEFEPLQSVSDALTDWGLATSGGFDSDFAGLDFEGDGDFYGPFDVLPFMAGADERWSPPAGYTGASGGSSLQTSVHGVNSVAVPEPGEFEMFVPDEDGSYDLVGAEYVDVGEGNGSYEKGAYHENADLSIISFPDGTWQVFNSHGLDVTADLVGIVQADSMYDARQAEGSGANIQTTRIDVGQLNASGYFPANGLLYVAGYGSGTGTNVKGFQFENAAELSTSLNIVSPDSVYLQGDFNTVDKKPAAVIADAVNLLSNSWDGTKLPGVLPLASETTYNVSFVTGDTASTSATFAGGPHNLLRRHEDWLGVPERILGSIVGAFRSTKATGTFNYLGDYYYPPLRTWAFDESLNDVDSLPPFTPVFVDASDVAIW